MGNTKPTSGSSSTFPAGGSSRDCPARGCAGHPCTRDGIERTAAPETWPLVGHKEVLRRISKKEKELRAAATKSGSASESEWLPAAIVYVPEAAPVLHRNDVGVTAAVSAEEVAFSDLHAEAVGHCALKPAFARPRRSRFARGIDGGGCGQERWSAMATLRDTMASAWPGGIDGGSAELWKST